MGDWNNLVNEKLREREQQRESDRQAENEIQQFLSDAVAIREGIECDRAGDWLVVKYEGDEAFKVQVNRGQVLVVARGHQYQFGDLAKAYAEMASFVAAVIERERDVIETRRRAADPFLNRQ